VTFNGTPGAPSIYRGSPSPEVEAAWNNIAVDGSPVRMTLEELLRTGEKPSPDMARYPDAYGGGYMASIESNHMLHCLNMLRKVTWGDHYGPSGNDVHESPEYFRIHLDHCIELLRQYILCHSDVVMISYDWERSDAFFPNFNVRHQCRDFEKILDWVDEHRVVIPKSEMVRLEDTVDLLSPP
ncbi:uncharacterized protein EDB91DRAFT_1062835, partial [Suillus paluster]|uniref:uncharacterized protein n=1 Tax=Suillus paluster TaxID=48578 RepID=UPI001B87A843